MTDSYLFPIFLDMVAQFLVQGKSLAESNTQSQDIKSATKRILLENRNAVAALTLTFGLSQAMAANLDSSELTAAQVALNNPKLVLERSREQKDFLRGLDQHLKTLAERGIVAKDTANVINQGFLKFAQSSPKVYEQPGFEYAIPTIQAFTEPYGALFEKSLERSTSRTFQEILGMQTVTEDNIGEIFRHMFAAKKEDGIFYEIFVKEVFRLMIEDGSFRTKSGEVDKQAVFDAIDRYQATNTRWQEKLEEMRRDGSLNRFVLAVNNAMAYAEKKHLKFKPTQVRKGLVHTASCIAAKPETNPSLYADSCAYTMTWMAERPHAGAIELQFFNPETGEAGYKRTMAPWDAAYAQQVYGPVFSDTQAKANDNFWQDYFKLYMGTARANEATAIAEESEVLLNETKSLRPLIKSMSRLALLLRCYVEGTLVDDKKVTLTDIQTAFDISKKLKDEIDSRIGQKTKNDDNYKQLASNYRLITSRALLIGIK